MGLEDRHVGGLDFERGRLPADGGGQFGPLRQLVLEARTLGEHRVDPADLQHLGARTRVDDFIEPVAAFGQGRRQVGAALEGDPGVGRQRRVLGIGAHEQAQLHAGHRQRVAEQRVALLVAPQREQQAFTAFGQRKGAHPGRAQHLDLQAGGRKGAARHRGQAAAIRQIGAHVGREFRDAQRHNRCGRLGMGPTGSQQAQHQPKSASAVFEVKWAGGVIHVRTSSELSLARHQSFGNAGAVFAGVFGLVQGHIGTIQGRFQRLARPVQGDTGREGHEDILALVVEQRRRQRTLQPYQHLLGFVERRVGQHQHELLAAVARHQVTRPQRGLGAFGQRLEGDVAGVVAQAVVELLEVVDVQQGQRDPGGLALGLGLFNAEGLDQAAAVGDLRQLVGMDFAGQPPQLAFELVHPLRQRGGAVVLQRQACLGLGHQALHAAAFLHHLAHRAGQAFERIGLLDGVGIAADVVLEAVGVLAQFAELGQHALDQALERITGLGALLAQGALALAGAGQQFGDGSDAATGQALSQGLVHRLGLALGPGVVLGQVHEAGTQLAAQAAEFVEQVAAVVEQVAGAQAQGRHPRGPLGAGALALEFGLGRFKLGDQRIGRRCLGLGRTQRVAHRDIELGTDLGPLRRRCRLGRRGRVALAGAAGLGKAGIGKPGVGETAVGEELAGGAAVLAGFDLAALDVLVPALDQLPQALDELVAVGAGQLQHTGDAFLLARQRPVPAAALQAAHQALDRLGQRLGLRARPGGIEQLLDITEQLVVALLAQRGLQLLALGARGQGQADQLGHQLLGPLRHGAVGSGRAVGAGFDRIGPAVVLRRRLQPGLRQALQRRFGELCRGQAGTHGQRCPRARSTLASACVIQGALRGSTVWAIQRSSSSAGSGLLNRKPCISEQPRRCSTSIWRRVSTPSAMTRRPRARASAMIAVTTAELCGVMPRSRTKVRSTLTSEIGSVVR
mmetsp:Transcript_22377/g.88473  ORF Transcript_22377/g.88473 Transcript_22377/m.88473 type:complete len:961 (-) Transcript_22377:1086-3968(-)